MVRKPSHPHKRKAPRLVLGVFIIGALGLVLIINCHLLPGSNEGRLSGDQMSEAEREKNIGADSPSVIGPVSEGQDGIPGKSASDPRRSFLLLGYGGAGHDGAYLTDSMMFAISDPSQKTLTLLSIPRDCWIPLLFDGKTAVYNKANTAYAFAKDTELYSNRLNRYSGNQGAGRFASDTISRLLGVPVSNYLALDFQGFREMIDTVGGIDVNVPDSFSARYPANDDSEVDPNSIVVHFTKGVEHMNGERAIEFARAREAIDNLSEASDFARSRRQRIIMEAFKNRLLEPGGLIHLPQILSIAAGHVDTDYGIGDVTQLSQLILGSKDVRIYQTALTNQNYLNAATGPNGTYALIPATPDGTWSQIRAFMRRLWEDPATGVAMADTRIVVVNDTGQSGAASRLSEALVKLGYRVGTPEQGGGHDKSRLVDRTGGRAKPVAAQLQKDLGVHLEETSETSEANSNELVLDLGANDKGLADLTVPADNAAASSLMGIENIEGRGADAPSPSVKVYPTATVAQPTSTSTSTRMPLPTATGTSGVTATPTPVTTSTPPPSPTRAPSATPTVVPPTATPTRTPVITPHPGATARP